LIQTGLTGVIDEFVNMLYLGKIYEHYFIWL
jgi:hypothetical protein